ncbi:hypothetical protein D3C81_1037040 [compost metagenome]
MVQRRAAAIEGHHAHIHRRVQVVDQVGQAALGHVHTHRGAGKLRDTLLIDVRVVIDVLEEPLFVFKGGGDVE